MPRSNASPLVKVLAASAALALPWSSSVLADFDGPAKPRIDCTKKANKNKPACQNHHAGLSDDEIYNAAYWMARQGQYAAALDLLHQARNGEDPRILNALGYATRKQGDIDGALPYYQKALAIDPNHLRTREYLGEALVAKGDLAGARMQLSEIEIRCGRECTGYPELAKAIADYEAVAVKGG